jgi:DNA primase
LAYKAKLAASKENQSQLVNLGTVKTVLQAEAYTYLEVADLKQGVIWLAGPKISIQPNSLVRYSKGVVMSGFYSKELNRSFKEILFVGQIQKVE